MTMQRGVTCWFVLMLMGALVACGSDGGGGDMVGDGDMAGDGDGDQSGDGDGDASIAGDGDRSGDGDAAGDGDTAGDGDSTPVTCDDGEQDNDGDGTCEPGCTPSTDCGNGGCQDATGEILCQCEAGWAGAGCEDCAEGHTGVDCGDCADGYIRSDLDDDYCIADPCLDVECGNSGSCWVVEDVAECFCDMGFDGDACNVCADGYTGAACDTCDDNYSPDMSGACFADVCVDKDCGAGTCAFEPPATAVCNCDTGYELGESGKCDTCELGYVLKDDACVLDLPEQGSSLAVWLDADNAGRILKQPGSDWALTWQSKVPGGPTTNAIYDGDFDHAPEALRRTAIGRTMLTFDGDDNLKLQGLPITEAEYSVFIAMRPSGKAGAIMTPVAAIGQGGDAGKHGLQVRSEGNGTSVRFIHRSPLASSGGDDVVSGDVDVPGLYDPSQVVTAERRMVGGQLRQLVRVNGAQQDASTLEPAHSQALDMLIGELTTAGASPFTGHIGEIVIYNGAISEDARAAVEAYLSKKWAPKKRFVVAL